MGEQYRFRNSALDHGTVVGSSGFTRGCLTDRWSDLECRAKYRTLRDFHRRYDLVDLARLAELHFRNLFIILFVNCGMGLGHIQ